MKASVGKVFKNGRSQAIRLPKEFRVKTDEVTIRRVPEGLLLIERDPWEICREACAELSEEFLTAAGKREQPAQRKRDWKGVFE